MQESLDAPAQILMECWSCRGSKCVFSKDGTIWCPSCYGRGTIQARLPPMPWNTGEAGDLPLTEAVKRYREAHQVRQHHLWAMFVIGLVRANEIKSEVGRKWYLTHEGVEA